MSLFGEDRSTVDIVLILLTITCGSMLVAATIGLTVLHLLHPEADTSLYTTSLGNALLAVLGYIVGRTTVRAK